MIMLDNKDRKLLDEIKEKTDLAEVVRRYIDINRSNKALCPFHPEKQPSLWVPPNGSSFHCFGCHRHGDAIDIIEFFERTPFWDVVRDLAGKAGIQLPQLKPEQIKKLEDAHMIDNILFSTALFYHRNMTDEALAYLIEKRGLSDESIEKFKIGYAGGGLRRHLVDDLHYDPEKCIEAGVLKKGDDSTVRDFFYKRIIFPNFKRGRVVHMTGRSLDDKDPKYLHMPGKIDHLFNEDALSSGEAIITEGPLDCITIEQAGYSAVAVLGTNNFKPEYKSKFARCNTAYLCFDGDDSGRTATLKVGQLLGAPPRVIELPAGYDPNDYFRDHTHEDFRILFDKADDFIEYQVNNLPRHTKKIELRSKLEPIMQQLAHMEPVDAEAYLSSLIKDHFRLNRESINEYRGLIRRYRKEMKKDTGASLFSNRENAEYKALFEDLVDIVEHEGESAFMVKNGNDLEILTEVERGGVFYQPPPKESMPWLLPRANEVLKAYHGKDDSLWDDLVEYHKKISELPGDGYYNLLAAWDFHSHLTEGAQCSPMICLFSNAEHGKSRTGKGMIHVARRGVYSESVRPAYLFRFAGYYQASIFLDVMDVWQKALRNNCEDILLHRFEKGARVFRITHPELGALKDMTGYHVFGPTIIGTNRGVDEIFETRAIIIHMQESAKRFEIDVTRELALPLKTRLTAFRARHMWESLPDIEKPAQGRLGDLTKPLMQVIHMVKPDRAESFTRLIKELEAKRRIEKSESLEAALLSVIINMKGKKIEGDSPNSYVLPVKTIADAFNGRKASLRQRITYQKVGRRLLAMGFKKVRHEHRSAIIWDEKQIEQMIRSYGLEKDIR